MKDAGFWLYGERGVVNGLLLDMHGAPAGRAERLNAFFRAIRLHDGAALPWAGGVEDCVWMVEPSFAEYGNPDLIATFTSGGKRFGVFFEAKLKDYRASSLMITEDMTAESYLRQASKLNVQLALRYRFVQAYRTKGAEATIREEDGHHPDGRRRKLDKATVVEALGRLLQGVEEYYYVALTHDDPAMLMECPLEDCYLPPVRQVDQARMRKRLGLLTYTDLMSAGVVQADSGFFGAAAALMGLRPIVPHPQALAGVEGPALVNMTSIQDLPGETRNWLHRILREQRLARLEEQAGSYSAKAEGRTVMKLMAAPEDRTQLMLGLRYPHQLGQEHAHGKSPVVYRINGVPFSFYSFRPEESDALVRAAAFFLDTQLPEDVNLNPQP